ncbi:MAG: hypothetical protein MJ127_03255 [Mogibacterium sp.]|nr:hypothetical protein [Mogibacterium sp.]
MKKSNHIYVIGLILLSLILAYFLGYDMYIKTRPIVFGLLSGAIGIHVAELYKDSRHDQKHKEKE